MVVKFSVLGLWWVGILMLVLAGGCAALPEGDEPGSGQGAPVKDARLEAPIATLRVAEAEDAGGVAPKSYQKARQAWDDARATIAQAPDDPAAIEQAVARFAFEVEHLAHITREVKELRAIDRQVLENVVLSAEYRLLAIADALRVPDLRRHDLYKQSVLLAEAVERLMLAKPGDAVPSAPHPVSRAEQDMLRDQVDALRAQLGVLRTRNTELAQVPKPLHKRIDELERLVLQLNAQKEALEEHLAKTIKPPPEGVEISPVERTAD
jgi:DNA repair ATPase RecN